MRRRRKGRKEKFMINKKKRKIYDKKKRKDKNLFTPKLIKLF